MKQSGITQLSFDNKPPIGQYEGYLTYNVARNELEMIEKFINQAEALHASYPYGITIIIVSVISFMLSRLFIDRICIVLRDIKNNKNDTVDKDKKYLF